MEQKFQLERLGSKTFRVFLFERLWLFVGIIILMAALAYARQFMPASYEAGLAIFFPIGFLIALVALGIGFGVAWLEYTHYSIFLDEQSIKVRRGIVSVEEVGFPFKRIKEVRMERSPMDQILGVSSLIITSGVEESESDTEIDLPNIGSELAEILQNEILRRSAVEDIRTVSSSQNER